MNSTSKETITYGAVHLQVTDLDQSKQFWTQTIGLKVRKEAKLVELGTDNNTLVVLHPGAKTAFRNGFSGLYHLALHISTEPEFARVLQRLITKKQSISPTDHIMSKAIYLLDPDGITVEITLETPERFKGYASDKYGFAVIDSEGNYRGATERLDTQAVLATLPDNNLDQSVPNNTKVGHVHLYVNDLNTNYEFYNKLGFEDNYISRSLGFADLSAGGIFKHRIAMNTWMSLGSPQAPEDAAGMRYFELKINDKKLKDQVLQDLSTKHKDMQDNFFTDPSGNRFVII